MTAGATGTVRATAIGTAVWTVPTMMTSVTALLTITTLTWFSMTR